MLYDQIQKQLASFIHLDPLEMAQFLPKLQLKQLKRKELLLRAGDVCRQAYFINHGCLRYFHVVDGEEITGQFFFENSWYADYRSYLSGNPSDQFIEALEPTELLVLAKTDMETLYHEIPKFEKFGRLMAENAFLGLRDRTEMLTNQTAEERYIRLQQERPKVMARVPQHYIASYLGIKAPSLSRIRKRLATRIS
jgi:CRP/FNR family transcriptional regulator, anaerobic regulatory protein